MTDDLTLVRCGCGGEAKVRLFRRLDFAETGITDFFVQCDKCGIATLMKDSEAEAITAWNRVMGAKDINVPNKNAADTNVGDKERMVMNNLIKREDVLKYVDSWLKLDEYYHPESKDRNIPYLEVRRLIERVPTVPVKKSEVIRCRDCKWWDSDGNIDIGYCNAIKHSWLTEHWEITIRRTYKGDFYCADAELKNEGRRVFDE